MNTLALQVGLLSGLSICSTLKTALAGLLFLHLVLKYQKVLLTFSGAILSIWLVASIFGFLLVSRF